MHKSTQVPPEGLIPSLVSTSALANLGQGERPSFDGDTPGFDFLGMPLRGFRPSPPTAEKVEQSRLDSQLDTIEQLPLSAYYEEKRKQRKENLSKRARSKFVTNEVAFPLSKLRSPLEKAYKLTATCSAQLTETPGKLTGKYCGARWCLVCARMRTARLFAGYEPAIEAMGDEKYFLTLSRRTVPGHELDAEVQYYIHTATLIQRHLREKRKLQYSSLRKIECTYNAETNKFHPHFHFIFDNFEAADLFLQQWLERNSVAAVGAARAAELDHGNQLKKADKNAWKELFKYFTKVVTKSQSKVNGKTVSDYRIHLAALDTMFVALRGVRTFQPCGVIKAISEEIEPELSLESGRNEVHFHEWMGHDWVDRDTEKALTGFIPSEAQQDIKNHIVYPAGVQVKELPDLMPFYVDKHTGEVVPHQNAHLVRDYANDFAKFYPMPAQEPPKRGCALVPTHELAIEAQPRPVVEPAAVPAQPQLALFTLLPNPISNPVKPQIRAKHRPNLQPLNSLPSRDGGIRGIS